MKRFNALLESCSDETIYGDIPVAKEEKILEEVVNILLGNKEYCFDTMFNEPVNTEGDCAEVALFIETVLERFTERKGWFGCTTKERKNAALLNASIALSLLGEIRKAIDLLKNISSSYWQRDKIGKLQNVFSEKGFEWYPGHGFF